MPLGMEVGLSPGDFVFDGDQLPPEKKSKTTPTQRLARLLWPNGRIDKDATWYGCRPRPRLHCIRPAIRERDTAAPSFRRMSIVEMSPISATAELV